MHSFLLSVNVHQLFPVRTNLHAMHETMLKEEGALYRLLNYKVTLAVGAGKGRIAVISKKQILLQVQVLPIVTQVNTQFRNR